MASLAPTTPTGPASTLSRRGLARAAVASTGAAGLAGAAVGAAGSASAEDAATTAGSRWLTRRHRRNCHHYHRCPLHPDHTCRHKHRCRHLRHRRPTTPTPEPPTPEPPTPEPPTPEPPTPDASAAFAAHVGNRLAYGLTPALAAQIETAGGPDAWVEQQLDPASLSDAEGDALEQWWTCLGLDHAAIVQRDRDGVEYGWQAMNNYARWCLMRRIVSERQLLETMAEFWEHHLHVPLHDDGVYPHRIDYGRVVRSHALGRFDELLAAAVLHPAMGVSLDNASSTKRAPNENLGRELLELHTVGKGNHTEDDVKNAARILTGYYVDTWRTWNAAYKPENHWTGPVAAVGFTHANAAADGRPVAEAFLAHLAHHPRTADRIARKLAVRFVSDDPSPDLLAHLAQVYLDHDTAIAPLVRALVAHPEFRAAVRRKVRTPTDDVVATHRALGTRFAAPVSDSSAANAFLWSTSTIGQSPFAWPRPDGQPQANPAWSSASRVLASFDVHYTLAHGWWPRDQISYRTPEQWLPSSGMRFDAFCDHLSRLLLGKPVDAALVQALCPLLSDQWSRVTPATPMTPQHPVLRWRFGQLLATFLDSPEHLHR